ncbi:MAG: hypothetical protein WC444_06750 [Candidatus Paceibacterota bacterium]
MATLSRPNSGSFHDDEVIVITPRSTYTPKLKVLVTLHSGTQVDLASSTSPHVLNISVTRKTLNRGFGTFTVDIDNTEGKWNSIITGGERIDIYADFTDATNQIFRGKIDAPFKSFDANNGYFMVLEGREAPEVQDRLIVESVTSQTVYVLLSSMVTNWFSSILTTTNMSTGMTTLIYRDYTWAKPAKIFSDALNKAGYYGYLDFDYDIHTFTQEINTAESVVIGQNLAAVNNYGEDLLERRNNIIMTGDKVESAGNFYYAKSKKDSTDIASFWQKDLLVNDNNLHSQEAIETDVSLKLGSSNVTDTKGTLTVLHGLPTLRPGQSIYCECPRCDISGLHIVQEFTHNISAANWVTTLSYERNGTELWDIISLRDDKITGNIQASNNPNAITDAICYTFEESSSQFTHTNTQELNSTLMLDTGQSSGSATSITKYSDAVITGVELRIHGQDYNSCTFEFSVDNGSTWQGIGLNTLTVPTVEGIAIKIRFNLQSDTDNPTPKIWSAWLGYK